MNNFGITKNSLRIILTELTRYRDIEKVSIFGSRAIGNYKRGSDIDMVIFGCDMAQDSLNELRIRLNEELPLPYHFDVVHYESLADENLKEHIDRFAMTFYSNDQHEAIQSRI